MGVALSDSVQKLLSDPNIAHVATVMADGSPQVSAVWIDHDGTHVLCNTAEGRQKPKNLRRDPCVALSIADRQNPYVSATIRGRVVEMAPEGADEHIDKLAKKYMGVDSYPNRRAGEQRLIVKIEPEHVSTMG